MCFKTFLSARSSHKSRDQTFVGNSTQETTSAPPNSNKRNASRAVFFGLRKAFHTRRRDDTVVTGATLPAESSTPKRTAIFRYPSPKQQLSKQVSAQVPTDPATVESNPSATDADFTVDTESQAPTSSTPPTTPGSERSTPYTENTETIDTIRPKSSISNANVPYTQPDAHLTEYEIAVAGMREAEKLLSQRHAIIEHKANISKKVKAMELIVKKTRPKNATIPLPAIIHPVPRTLPAHSKKTANDAVDALRCRQYIKNLTYDAAEGCPAARSTIHRINAYFAMKQRHPEEEHNQLIINFSGARLNAEDFGTVEHMWIARYNVIHSNASLVERRLMNEEDHETIVFQLFPEDRDQILKREYFDIFVIGLGHEGVLTESQAKAISRMSVTTEELDKGARYTGPYKDTQVRHRYNPSDILIFQIPKEESRTADISSPRRAKSELHFYLRILIEAAVYDQKFWKGFFLPNARSQLTDYYEAYELTQEGKPTSPYLTEYKRPWTFREARLMQRGLLICSLLVDFQNGIVTDFGILRAVRSTFVPLPAQSFFSVEELESFLYHRVADSGISACMIPRIIALHPENDATWAKPRLRHHLVSDLKERAEQFEQEEAQRRRDIASSYSTFESVRKAQMSMWERVVARLGKVLGKKEVLVPFDPFAPEHGGHRW